MRFFMTSIHRLGVLGLGILLLGACGSDDPTETASSVTQSSISEEISEKPVEAEPVADLVDVPDTQPTSTRAPDTGADELESTCDAPDGQARYVDVALDDPDGGLNMRTAPGIDNVIIEVFPRSSEVITTGGCLTLVQVDWWEVRSPDGTASGWVSSRYLSELLVFNPGDGKTIEDTENLGISGVTLDELAANLAEVYGFDDDATITMIGEPIGADAQGGSVVYEMTGLKDDAVNGFRVDIEFVFDTSEDPLEVVSYTAIWIEQTALCTRGVTDDGLCV